MSDKTDKLSAAYLQMSETEGGKHLIDWIEKNANDIRRKAINGKTEYELGRADGLEEVTQQINQMKGLPKIR